MTRGRELPVNSKVRRRLFQDDPPEPYPEWNDHDQLNKVIKTEYIARTLDNHLILKGMKWNFDFQSEKSLRGCLQWYRRGNSDTWVFMEPTGRSIHMRKRSREPMSGLKFTYEEERRAGRKKRRLSPHTVALRRGFFNDGRVQNMAMSQAEDENFTNEFNDEPPLPNCSPRGYGRPPPPWYPEEETESDDDPSTYLGHAEVSKYVPKPSNQPTNQVLPTETLKNNEINDGNGSVDGVETVGDAKTINGLADHTLADACQLNNNNTRDVFPVTSLIIEVDKDDNDNDKPLISEDKFKKLHIDDKDSGEKEQTEERKNDIENYEVEQKDTTNYDEEQTDMKTKEEEKKFGNNEEEQTEMKNKNEATPKNEKKKDIAKQKKGKAKARNGKAKKKLYNSRY